MSEELKPQAQTASVVTTAESAYLEEVKKIENRNDLREKKHTFSLQKHTFFLQSLFCRLKKCHF